MAVSPPATGIIVVRVPHVTLRLHAHLVGPLVSLGFDVYASVP
jgi:hypothetical protein